MLRTLQACRFRSFLPRNQVKFLYVRALIMQASDHGIHGEEDVEEKQHDLSVAPGSLRC